MADRTLPSSVRVLLAQLAPRPGDVAGNVARVVDTLRSHPSAELALFPELFLTGYEAERAARLACTLDDPAVVAIREAAAASRTAVIVGFAERGADGAAYNAALCVDRDGTIADVHRKTLLFGGPEKRAFASGDAWPVVDLAGVPVGVQICFEIEFPEPARAQAVAGARLLASVAANMAPYRRDHHLASVARALDNRVPHAYVNRVGEEAGLRFVGGSQVVDDGGRIWAAVPDGEQAVERTVAIARPTAGDTDYLRQLRSDLPTRRRPTESHG